MPPDCPDSASESPLHNKTNNDEAEKEHILSNTSPPDTSIDAGALVYLDTGEPIEYKKRLENLRLKKLGVRTEEKKMQADGRRP